MESKQNENKSTGASDIVNGVGEVVGAVLGIGAAVAKTVAQATSGGKEVPAPSGGGPINAMVHYGVAAVSNVVGTVLSSVNVGAAPARPAKSAAPSSPAPQATTLPRVRRGASLRIPLSIENPGDEPMRGMSFTCLRMNGGKADAGTPLRERALRFQPETLDVAPKDFEKLTVYIDTAPDTAPARYEAVIGLDQGVFETTIVFEVIA